MALNTVQPTANTTPDPGLGGDAAVTTPTNTGHAGTLAQDTGPGAAVNKSCRWSGFALTGQITKVTLKFDWQITSGGADTDTSGGGTASADSSFIVTLSVDGGTTFPTTALTRSCSISGTNSASLIESGSVSFDISPIPTISQVQVRDRLHANATASGGAAPPASASASVTANISNIQLQITTVDNTVVAIM